MSADGRLLVPGESCATLVDSPRSGLLVDGRDFYRALHRALLAARRSVYMAGWQFGTSVRLLRGPDAEGCELPVDFVPLLAALCERNPELEVHLLAWDSSAVFAFEREPLQKLMFHLRGHERVHFHMDNCHPVGGSQHQKYITIDRSIAFVGGMDVTTSRWDDRSHPAIEPLRSTWRGSYTPYHDVQCYLTGDAVDVLRSWFARRWQLATGAALDVADAPREEIEVEASVPLEAPAIGLSRTWPEIEGVDLPQSRELLDLHRRAIAAAREVIYMENQYFSSDELERALVARMESDGPRLEIVLVLPQKSAGLKERLSIGVYQARILARLRDTARARGHRLGVYYHAAPGPEGDVPVFIHAKVLAVDDRFLLVSSANFTNRSMSFDSELGVAWEAPAATDALRAARVDLLREHAGLSAEEAARLVAPVPGLVARLDRIADDRSHRLRRHGLNQDELPGPILSRFVPDDPPLDPDHIEDLLPEPGVWLDRLVREPLIIAGHAGRELGRRIRRALGQGPPARGGGG